MILDEILGGGLLLFVAIMIIKEILHRRRCHAIATAYFTGIMMREEYQARGLKRKVYAPTYAFSVNGVDYHAAGEKLWKNPEFIDKSPRRDIRYNPANPDETLVDNRLPFGLFEVVAIAIGLVLIIV